MPFFRIKNFIEFKIEKMWHNQIVKQKIRFYYFFTDEVINNASSINSDSDDEDDETDDDDSTEGSADRLLVF